MEHVLYVEHTMVILESGTREEMIEALNCEYQDGHDVISLDDWRSEAHEFFEEVWNNDLGLYDKIDIIQNSLGYELYLYENDEHTFGMIFGDNAYEAVRAVYYGDYRPQDEFVTFDGYENLVSLTKEVSNMTLDILVNIDEAVDIVDEYIEEFIEYRIDENGW